VATCENVLLKRTNEEHCNLSLIAKFEDTLPVSYVIRVTDPNGRIADYVCGLKCFNVLNELFSTLQYFTEIELYPDDATQLKDVLTAETLKTFAEILKSTKE